MPDDLHERVRRVLGRPGASDGEALYALVDLCLDAACAITRQGMYHAAIGSPRPAADAFRRCIGGDVWQRFSRLHELCLHERTYEHGLHGEPTVQVCVRCGWYDRTEEGSSDAD